MVEGRSRLTRAQAASGPGQIDSNRSGEQGAAPFQDANFHASAARRQGQAQYRRRRLAGDAVGADQDERGGAFFSGQLEAPQGTHVGVGQPQHDDLATA